MASLITTTIHDTITKTVAASSAAAATASLKAPAQGGVIEHQNPSVYDPKNPIVTFIIQVCNLCHLISVLMHRRLL